MFGAILKATKSPFQKGMTFCRNIYVKKVMKLLAFIFEQPSYIDYEQRSLFMNLHSCYLASSLDPDGLLLQKLADQKMYPFSCSMLYC